MIENDRLQDQLDEYNQRFRVNNSVLQVLNNEAIIQK